MTVLHLYLGWTEAETFQKSFFSFAHIKCTTAVGLKWFCFSLFVIFAFGLFFFLSLLAIRTSLQSIYLVMATIEALLHYILQMLYSKDV